MSRDLEGKGGLYLEGALVAVHAVPADGECSGVWIRELGVDEATEEEELWELSKSFVGAE